MIYLKRIRAAKRGDLPQIIAIDAGITGLRKPAYWSGILSRYGTRQRHRYFLVAETDRAVQGYIVGEVRDWEFGSPPCGWVFTIAVRPDTRVKGLGTQLLNAICDAFRHAGVGKVRTLIPREQGLMLSFFRSQGMMAAPVIPLEKEVTG